MSGWVFLYAAFAVLFFIALMGFMIEMRPEVSMRAKVLVTAIFSMAWMPVATFILARKACMGAIVIWKHIGGE